MMTFELNPEVSEDGWTQSEISTMDVCGKKWFWQYHERLRKKGDMSWALMVGSAFHDALEQMYATAGKRWSVPALKYPGGTLLTGNQQLQEVYWQHVLPAMCTAYSQHYHTDFDNFVIEGLEEIVEIEYMGFKFRGMIDMRYRPVAHDGIWIMDHKTTSRLNLEVTAAWDFRFQFMFYLWLKYRQLRASGAKECDVTSSMIRGYYVNGVKKPELRLGKKETIEQFAERVRVDMVMEPQKYFYREKLAMTRGAIDVFENHVLAPKIERLRQLSGVYDLPPAPGLLAGVIAHNMNTEACQSYGKPCQFIDLCRHGFETMGYQYEQREHKHEELEEVEI